MKDRSRKGEGKRRKEGEIIERSNGENWVETERRGRGNCSKCVVR